MIFHRYVGLPEGNDHVWKRGRNDDHDNTHYCPLLAIISHMLPNIDYLGLSEHRIFQNPIVNQC